MRGVLVRGCDSVRVCHQSVTLRGGLGTLECERVCHQVSHEGGVSERV